MANYQISIQTGCDETTSIDFELDQHEIPLVYEIAGRFNAGDRFPRINVKRIN